MKYLITAHPRSGTKYMSELFKNNGHDVGHEEMGKDGTSNWQMAVYANEYPYKGKDNFTRMDIEFDMIIQVIRNPIDAVSSIAFTEQPSEWFRSKYISIYGNFVERAILSYVGWNKLILSQAPDMILPLEKAAQMLNFNDVEKSNQRGHYDLKHEQIKEIVNKDIYELLLRFEAYYNTL
jgi:hypothetical protein